jgi:hypothetical protein
MKPKRKFAQTLCIALLAGLATTSATAAVDDEAFDAALELYHVGHYSSAYGRLAALADEGHAEAARIALLMFRYGPQLYGSAWSASPDQVERWSRLASVKPPNMVAEHNR